MQCRVEKLSRYIVDQEKRRVKDALPSSSWHASSKNIKAFADKNSSLFSRKNNWTYDDFGVVTIIETV